MADYLWPAEVQPFAASFYLQPHTGGTESPFSRVRKVYGLSASRWVCRFSIRGGDSDKWGTSGFARWGPIMDALLARLKGGQNRVGIWDFRRPSFRGAVPTGNQAAAAGAVSMVLTGLPAGGTVLAGDYLGGDGRPHIIVADATANASGQATVYFEPPLEAGISSNSAVFSQVPAWFRLTSDDAGSNMSEVGQLTQYDLELVEDPLNAPAIFVPDTTLTINGVTILIAGEEVEM